jgi:hypothetical protein
MQAAGLFLVILLGREPIIQHVRNQGWVRLQPSMNL